MDGYDMDYKIRKLEPEKYNEINNNVWDISKNREMSKKWYEQLVSGNRITFIYTENGKHLGQCDLVFDMGDSDYTIKNKRIYLSRMIVKPECRNRGIGNLLIDFLANYAKNLGYEEMSLGVDIVNVGARWLYEKNGFTNIIFVGEDKDGKYVKLLKTL